ncbi:MAG: RagB/SusD family nutrient uptake outer membrane protein [Butyricimonas faecihominis]
MYWRLADIYLLRAECQAYQTTAADDLNEIRRRAYGGRDHDYSAAEGISRWRFSGKEKELLLRPSLVRHRAQRLESSPRACGLRLRPQGIACGVCEPDGSGILTGRCTWLSLQICSSATVYRQNVFWNKNCNKMNRY